MTETVPMRSWNGPERRTVARLTDAALAAGITAEAVCADNRKWNVYLRTRRGTTVLRLEGLPRITMSAVASVLDAVARARTEDL